MDRDSKKRRVSNALGSARHVNRSVVVQVVRCLEPDNDDLDPKQIYGDLSKATKRLTTDLIYNITVEPVDPGGPTTVALRRVQDLLPHILTHCEGFRGVLTNALKSFPNDREHPWHLIMYMDEITPGNPLHLESQKKITAIYSGFLEFQHALRYEESWMVNGCVRSTLTKKIKGGLSSIIRELIRSRFCMVDSATDAGVVIPLQRGPQLLFMQFLFFHWR